MSFRVDRTCNREWKRRRIAHWTRWNLLRVNGIEPYFPRTLELDTVRIREQLADRVIATRPGLDRRRALQLLDQVFASD